MVRKTSKPDPGSVHKRRVAERIRKVFDSKIDIEGVQEEAKEIALCQRGLAAYCLCALGVADPDSAAQSVTDGGNDGGIDAVYIEGTARPFVYLVQTKWPVKVTKGVDEAAILKLMQGVSKILQNEWDGFNERILAHKERLQEAVLSPDAHFVVVVAAPSENLLAEHARKAIDNGIAEINGGLDPIVSCEVFDLKRLYRTLTAPDGASVIDLKITLHEWGVVHSPYQAFYGQLAVGDLLDWKSHGSLLFARNLRSFLGQKSDVYSSISDTLHTDPQHFWYFNNGATILCSSIQKAPLYGDKREQGIFDCKGVSVVNGAQTIGSVWDASKNGKDLDPSTRMPVRIISLDKCPESFANDVTRAANTQNRISSRDFAALDPNQSRIAAEMGLIGKSYVFRTGEESITDSQGCDIREATAAIACSLSLQLAVLAKRNLGAFWASIDKEPYTTLFNDELSAETLWRIVQIARSVDAALEKNMNDASLHRGPLIARHGNRFILYRAFKDPAMLGYEKMSEDDFAAILGKASEIAKRELALISEYIRDAMPSAYPQVTFKNAQRCEEIDKNIPRGSIGSSTNTGTNVRMLFDV